MVREVLSREDTEYTVPLSRAAVEAGVSQSTLRRLAMDKKVPHRRRGLERLKRYFFRDVDVMKLREAYVIGYDPA